MGSLKTLFGAAAVAANMVGSADAQDLNSGITTIINGVDGRVQVNPLPQNPLPDFVNPEQMYRNPAHRAGQVQRYDSIGDVDERIGVTHAMREYDPVLQMMDSNGNVFCTATIATIKGFEIREQGAIITTAAHCMETRNPDTGAHIGYRNPQDIFFKGSYVDDNGMYEEFSMRADDVWVNPLYDENRWADEEYAAQHGYDHDNIIEADTALIFSKQLTPQDVTPAVVLPTNYNTSLQISDAVAKANDTGTSSYVTVAGYSGDIPYLTTHENAQITFGDYDGINNAGDIVPGASGGPVFLSGDQNTPIKFNESGQPMMLAVNSTVLAGTDKARGSYYNIDTLHEVPFLKEEGLDSDLHCGQSGKVLVDALNIRVSPDAGAQVLTSDQYHPKSQLFKGELFNVHGDTINQLGQAWALVTTEFGRRGYISANPAYVSMDKKSCFKL